jgi:uncharacterized protein (DUF952 family)
MTTILHITTREAWTESQATGKYTPDSLQIEGFIHFSTAQQVVQVANNFYHGQRGLVLLVVDTGRLAARLEWEPPVHPASASVEMPPVTGELFPHLYGALNADAVIKVVDFEPDDEGKFSLPEALE